MHAQGNASHEHIGILLAWLVLTGTLFVLMKDPNPRKQLLKQGTVPDTAGVTLLLALHIIMCHVRPFEMGMLSAASLHLRVQTDVQ